MTLLVIEIRENVVYEVHEFEGAEAQEEYFVEVCKGYGIEPCDANFEDGYMEFECGNSVCITSTDNGS